MNKKIIFITLGSLLFILFGGSSVWYFFIQKTPTGPGVEFPGEGDLSGKRPPEEVPTDEEPDLVQGEGETKAFPRLYELHKLPVAGVGLFEDGSGPYRSVSARYVERGLGHVFDTPLHTYKESRIVNETRPRITEALWGNNGRSVVLRYLDKDDAGAIITRAINILPLLPSYSIGTSTEETSVDFNKTEEVFFPDYIPFMSTAEDNSNTVFYLENNPGSSVGSISDYNNTNNSKIFNSSFTEWLPQFPNKSLVTLTTKPSSDVPGYMYFVNTKTNSIIKILSNIKGLTTLTSRNSSFVLYSETKNSLPELMVYSVAKEEALSSGLKTLPEKCVWGRENHRFAYCAVPRGLPPGEYPDQWYQGLISFSDELWEIDTNTMGKRKIMSPADFGVSSFDIINPSISSDDVYLVFTNKLTSTPWLYRISEEVPPQPLPPPLVPAVPAVATTTTKTPTSTKAPVMKKLK